MVFILLPYIHIEQILKLTGVLQVIIELMVVNLHS